MRGWISNTTWQIWRDGIKAQLKWWPFARGHAAITEDGTSTGWLRSGQAVVGFC